MAEGEQVERGDEEWETFAKKLLQARAKRTEKDPEEGIGVEDDDQEPGHRDLKKMLDPKLPSQEEVRQRNLTRVPCRSWCPRCVRGRGEEMDRKKSTRSDNEQEAPEYHVDY